MKVSQEEFINLVVKKLNYIGIPQENAQIVADVLLEAELREDKSHGINCITKIEDAIKKGDILPGKEPRIVKEEDSTAIIDGENVLGPVAGVQAMELAVEKARKYGSAVISLRKSHHLFAIGYYAKLACLNNMIGIVATSTSPAIFAPGGLEKVLGTNPIAIAIPSERNPIVLDFSSTTVSRGRIQEYAKTGRKIPLDWALDKDGNPTDDPNKALEGSLQTIGNYKGFGLALVIDILSSVLSGSASGREISGTSMHTESDKIGYKGDLFIVIDVSKFLDLDLFKSRVTGLTGGIKNSRRARDIHIPGESVYNNRFSLIEIEDNLYKNLEGI